MSDLSKQQGPVVQAAGTQEATVYGGFWIRVAASLVDTVLLLLIVGPILTLLYGRDYWVSDAAIYGAADALLNYILPALVIILFWHYKSATPGKMVFDLRIVDAETGAKPGTRQLVGRYLAYYVSMLPLLLGFFWVAFDKKKQGWHDKLAGTLVVRESDQDTL